jgi:hypothetical protein
MEIETASLVRFVCPALDLSFGGIGKRVHGLYENESSSAWMFKLLLLPIIKSSGDSPRVSGTGLTPTSRLRNIHIHL